MTRETKTKIDLLKALIRSATRKNVQDMWTLGVAYRDGYFEITGANRVVKMRKNRRLAYKWLKKAAECGCTASMLDIGALYADNKVLRRDLLKKGLEWELKAWCGGETSAANNIAITYAMLDFPIKCVQWLKRDSKTNGVSILLAACYLTGYGVRKDKTRGCRLLLEVEKDPWAFKGDVEFAKNMPQMQDSEILRKAFPWVKRCRRGKVYSLIKEYERLRNER